MYFRSDSIHCYSPQHSFFLNPNAQKSPHWRIFSRWPPALSWSALISVATLSLRRPTSRQSWPSCCPQSQTSCSDQESPSCHRLIVLHILRRVVKEQVGVFQASFDSVCLPLVWENVSHITSRQIWKPDTSEKTQHLHWNACVCVCVS